MKRLSDTGQRTIYPRLPSVRRVRPLAELERRLWRMAGGALVGTICGLAFGAMTL